MHEVSRLLADLAEFVHEHRFHGPLAADVTEPPWSGYLFTVTCPCGVLFERWATVSDAMDALMAWTAREG